jgi:hypothetical protein
MNFGNCPLKVASSQRKDVVEFESAAILIK